MKEGGEHMAKDKLKAVDILEELKDGKELLYGTLDTTLGHIEITKEELKELKKQLEQYPDYVVERELRIYHIRKKLGVVMKEKELHDKLDAAIAFLENSLLICQELIKKA